MNELAYFFFLTAEQRLEDTPLSLVERNIKKKFFPYLQPEFDQINDEISELTRELKRHLKKTVKLLNDFDANSLIQSQFRRSKSGCPTENWFLVKKWKKLSTRANL